MNTALHQAQKVRDTLIGGIITNVFTSSEYPSEQAYWGFYVLNPETNHKVAVWVNADPEGNGPGALEIEAA